MSFKKLFGKKTLVLGTLVVALGVAVYLNYYFAQSPSGLLGNTGGTTAAQKNGTDKKLGDALNVSAGAQSDYFETARENREKSRNEAEQAVKDMMTGAKITDDQKAQVAAQAAELGKVILQESKIEDLVRARGYGDCVVYIEGDKCSMVVRCDSLTVQDTARLSQIVTSQSAVNAQNINIVTVK